MDHSNPVISIITPTFNRSYELDHLIESINNQTLDHKYFEMIIDNDDEESVKKTTDSICSELLSNPVIETYNFTIEKI